MKKQKEELSDLERIEKAFGSKDVILKYSPHMGRYRLIKFTVPCWTIAPIINGDYTGELSEDDEESLKAFLDENKDVSFGDTAYIGFTRDNDVDHQAGDCSYLVGMAKGWANAVRKYKGYRIHQSSGDKWIFFPSPLPFFQGTWDEVKAYIDKL